MTDLRQIAAQVAHHGPARTGWAETAACRDMPKSAFFGTVGFGDGRAVYREARKACAGCPVILDCLSECLGYSYNEDNGLRAGLIPRERQQVRVLVREFTPRRVAS